MVNAPERLALPLPNPLTLQDVEWGVINTDDDKTYIVLTPDGYKILARNKAEQLRWTSEVKSQLDYYRGEEDGGTVD